jgi:hypothetical protein
MEETFRKVSRDARCGSSSFSGQVFRVIAANKILKAVQAGFVNAELKGNLPFDVSLRDAMGAQ